MTSYITYGTNWPLKDVLSAIESALTVRMSPHDSSYRGEYYTSGSSGQEHIVVQPNYLDNDDEWIEEKYQEYAILIYVNETPRAEQVEGHLHARMPYLQLLRREDL